MSTSGTISSILSIAVFLFIAGCGDKMDDGLVKQQVTGQVLVNGNPEKGIVVQFKHTDPTVTKNASRPVAVTDEQGHFQLSTNGEKDGAVTGTYIVSFFWPEGGNSTRDFLMGKYLKTQGSEYEVTVGDSNADIEPFKLNASASAVEAAHKAFQAKNLPQ
ncbi:hypothetical protein M4951_10995 [Blastopirellula sp. J2-11]|uniref:hypothetical protein n=1 Tax=Blastopirellula sp. J2-11 TaxID=2943192 RepID=UPI0021C61E20|nr:hypothetical protein [Blastopirellula sp. J2-11]UUO08817.1 hypothetical protein M4951_10995 [Blastopirellula sp. J2-11]